MNWIPEKFPLQEWWSADTFTAFTSHRNTAIGAGGSAAIIQSDAPVGTPPTALVSSAESPVRIGDSTSFIGLAQGTRPLHYQWLRNGIPIPGATDLVLTLQPVTIQDAAAYSLVVTNAFGSMVTPAELLSITSVAIGPIALEFRRNSLAEVTVLAPPGTKCRIESTDDLLEPDGWDARKVLTVGSAPFTWIDAVSAEAPQRFYRGMIEP